MESVFSEMYESDPSSAAFAQAYFSHLKGIFDKVDPKSVEAVADTMWQAYTENRHFYFMGNGGSFATASHCVNDFAKGTGVEGKRRLRVIPLTDPAALTAYGNDDGYEFTFMRQLEPLLEPGDVVTGISASGNSPNIVKAIEYANTRDARTVAWVGFEGGKLVSLAKQAILVPTARGEYGPVEDVHMVLDHLLVSYLHERISREGPNI